MSERFPFPPFPEGWFQVAYGEEVKPGAVHSMHYFGEQLICFRDSGGVAHVLPTARTRAPTSASVALSRATA